MIDHHSGILTHEECQELIDFATPQLHRNFRTTSAPGRTGCKIRDHHHLLHRLRCFAASLDETPSLDYVEDVEIVRYQPPAKYPPHCDCVWRSRTLLVYLNDNYVGGRTHFPRLQETITPITGNAISWVNAAGQQQLQDHVHEVRKLEEGIKWVAVIWTTFFKYNPDILSGRDPR